MDGGSFELMKLKVEKPDMAMEDWASKCTIKRFRKQLDLSIIQYQISQTLIYVRVLKTSEVFYVL